MPARPRREIVDAKSPGYYLVSQQVVRSLRLTGVDPLTGRDYTYRQEKLEQRIRDLASLYLVEVAEFSCGADGFQLLVRIRPVCIRWLLSMERGSESPELGRLGEAETQASFESGPYLQIGYQAFRRVLAWSLEALTAASRDVAPEVDATLRTVLDRFRVRVDVWLEAVRNFRRWFRTAVGCGDAMKSYARRLGVAWLAGQGRRRHPFVE